MNNQEIKEIVKKLFDKYSCHTALSEGHYDYLIDSEDFEAALIEFLVIIKIKENERI